MKCKVCGYTFTTPPNFCPKCLTKVESQQELVVEYPLAHQTGTQVEVVKPEVLAKWRRWGVPEEIITRAIRQRERMQEIRRVEEKIAIPNYAYTMPRIPEIEAQRWGFAKAIDADGTIDPRGFHGRDKIARIDRMLYRYEYRRPRVLFVTFSYDFTEEIANMMHTAVRIERVFDRLRGAYVIRYGAVAWTSRAVRICYLIEPYLTVPEKRAKARETITIYKKRPSIRVSRFS